MFELIFICLFLTSSTDTWNTAGIRQSTIALSTFGMEYSPVNSQMQFLTAMTADLLVDCAHNCQSESNCQSFSYDKQSYQCRLYNGDTQSTGSLITSVSSHSIVGTIELLPEQFVQYESPCSQCQHSRYLECVESTCQCPSNKYYDGSICQNQKFIDGQCSQKIHCRSDLNLKCAPSQKCTPWSLGVSMIHERCDFIAEVLNDGTILVAGGQSDEAIFIWNTAEVYDPLTITWSLVGNMTYERQSFAASVLLDGKVLVSGGCGSVALETVELYDPSTKKWILVKNMTNTRYSHTSTLLLNGTVLVVGGQGSPNTAELYYPTSNTWVSTANTNKGRYQHTASLLNDGTVLVVGGSYSSASAEIYNPTTNVWTPTSDMTYMRSEHTATVLPNGNVIVIGGIDNGSFTPEIYNVSTRSWTLAAPMNHGRIRHTATTLFDGRILVAGGFATTDPITSELYNPSTGQWTSAGDMFSQRDILQTVRLPNGDGEILAIGGNIMSLPSNTIEIYHP